MPISKTYKLKTQKSPVNLLKLVINKMSEKKATIVEVTPERIQIQLGSRFKAWLFGTALVSKTTLPVKITIFIREINKETELEIKFVDNIFLIIDLGIRLGSVGKYYELFDSIMDELKILLNGSLLL